MYDWPLNHIWIFTFYKFLDYFWVVSECNKNIFDDIADVYPIYCIPPFSNILFIIPIKILFLIRFLLF